MPDFIKHSAGLYTVYNEEQYLEAARLHWVDFGATYIDSGVNECRKPESYPVVVEFHVPTDPSGEEPQYMYGSFMYEDLIHKLAQSLTVHNPAQLQACKHLLADTPKAKPAGPSSRFSKIGVGQYLMDTPEGFRAAVTAFWSENGSLHKNVMSFVKGAPTRYPAYVTLVADRDDDDDIVGVIASCISVDSLSKSISKYG